MSKKRDRKEMEKVRKIRLKKEVPEKCKGNTDRVLTLKRKRERDRGGNKERQIEKRRRRRQYEAISISVVPPSNASHWLSLPDRLVFHQ